MLNLILCEFKKLRNSKIIFLCVIGSLAVPSMMFIEALQIHFKSPEKLFTLADIYDDSLLYTMILMNMMICVAILSFVFSREYSENTFKTILPIPVGRTKLFTAKFAVSALLTLAVNFITWGGILLISFIYNCLFTLGGFYISVSLIWLLKFLAGAVLMFLTASPFAYLAVKTKGFVAPMIVSAAVVMASAALTNQSFGALYPYTATYFFFTDKMVKSGYPLFLPIIIISALAFAGFFATFRFFKKEDIS